MKVLIYNKKNLVRECLYIIVDEKYVHVMNSNLTRQSITRAYLPTTSLPTLYFLLIWFDFSHLFLLFASTWRKICEEFFVIILRRKLTTLVLYYMMMMCVCMALCIACFWEIKKQINNINYVTAYYMHGEPQSLIQIWYLVWSKIIIMMIIIGNK